LEKSETLLTVKFREGFWANDFVFPGGLGLQGGSLIGGDERGGIGLPRRVKGGRKTTNPGEKHAKKKDNTGKGTGLGVTWPGKAAPKCHGKKNHDKN